MHIFLILQSLIFGELTWFLTESCFNFILVSGTIVDIGNELCWIIRDLFAFDCDFISSQQLC